MGDDHDDEEDEENSQSMAGSPVKSEGGVELNRRGIPARKRKKNSLIYGADDLVSIPIKSPKKRGPKNAAHASAATTAKDKRMATLAGERTSKSAPSTVSEQRRIGAAGLDSFPL